MPWSCRPSGSRKPWVPEHHAVAARRQVPASNGTAGRSQALGPPQLMTTPQVMELPKGRGSQVIAGTVTEPPHLNGSPQAARSPQVTGTTHAIGSPQAVRPLQTTVSL